MGTDNLDCASCVERNGFSIVPDVLGKNQLKQLINALSGFTTETGVRSRGGLYAIRNLLQLSTVCRELAWSAQLRTLVEAVLPASPMPVRATLFDKTANANWLVPWHQDLTICVKTKLEVPGYGPWSKKAGVWHVQPPDSVLARILSVRIHLDDCSDRNGALRVLPGTHLLGRLSAAQIAERQQASDSIICEVEAGGLLFMRPLLLHASSAGFEPGHRRVIHIDYASGHLDGGLQWATGTSGQQGA